MGHLTAAADKNCRAVLRATVTHTQLPTAAAVHNVTKASARGSTALEMASSKAVFENPDDATDASLLAANPPLANINVAVERSS